MCTNLFTLELNLEQNLKRRHKLNKSHKFAETKSFLNQKVSTICLDF